MQNVPNRNSENDTENARRILPATAPSGRRKPKSRVRTVHPLIKADLDGWPPHDLTIKEIRLLARQIARDLEQSLCAAIERPVESIRDRATAARTTPGRAARVERDGASAASTTGTGSSGGAGSVDCHLTGWEWEIVEVDGVPKRSRVEYYRCSDGSTFRREFPL